MEVGGSESCVRRGGGGSTEGVAKAGSGEVESQASGGGEGGGSETARGYTWEETTSV